MRKIVILALMAATAASLSAVPGRGAGLSPDAILAAAPGIEDKTPDQLTMGDRLAIATAMSVARQEAAYEHRAAAASFVLPGAGQLMTGDYGSAALHLAAQAAIIGGGMAAMWYLSPADLQDLTLSHEQRRDAMRAYFTLERIGQVLPGMGVAAAGMALSLANSVLASRGAGAEARANIDSGKVTFEPRLSMMGGGFGMGMALRLR